MTFEVPIRLRGGLNAREHWAVRHKRVKSERAAVALLFPLALRGAATKRPEMSYIVTFTLIAPRLLDDDGKIGVLKSVRDEVANQLGFKSDSDARLAWFYKPQARGAPRFHSVRVDIAELARKLVDGE